MTDNVKLAAEIVRAITGDEDAGCVEQVRQLLSRLTPTGDELARELELHLHVNDAANRSMNDALEVPLGLLRRILCRLTTLTPTGADHERMREALELVKAAMLRDANGDELGYGWDITALNRARPLIRAALKPTGTDTGQPFHREERYIVIKRKHLSDWQQSALRGHMSWLDIGTVECVVVERDWPEYEPVWAMIEARCGGGR